MDQSKGKFSRAAGRDMRGDGQDEDKANVLECSIRGGR